MQLGLLIMQLGLCLPAQQVLLRTKAVTRLSGEVADKAGTRLEAARLAMAAGAGEMTVWTARATLVVVGAVPQPTLATSMPYLSIGAPGKSPPQAPASPQQALMFSPHLITLLPQALHRRTAPPLRTQRGLQRLHVHLRRLPPLG